MTFDGLPQAGFKRYPPQADRQAQMLVESNTV